MQRLVARPATISTISTTAALTAALTAAAAATTLLTAAAAAAATALATPAMVTATGDLQFGVRQVGQKAVGFDQQFGNSDVKHCVFSLFNKLNPTNQVSIVFYGGLKD
jgi:ABC-type amino acid transport substrate-binding protein